MLPKPKLEPEYKDLYESYSQEPNKANTGALLRAVEPVLKSGVHRFTTGMTGSPTMRSRARRVALNAFSSYDSQKGSMRAHLMSHLQRLQRLAGQERQVIRMPEQVSLDQIRTDEAHNELQDKLGRLPSDRELADHTGLSLLRLAHIRRGHRPVAEGTITREKEEGTGGYDPATRSLNINNDPWLEFVYDDLGPRNQFIMERAFGLHGHQKVSPTRIAKLLKVSPGAVSQRMAVIQQKIDSVEDLGGI